MQEAIADYDRALALDHTFLSTDLNRGNAYEALGDLQHARADFGRVLEIDPMNNAAMVAPSTQTGIR